MRLRIESIVYRNAFARAGGFVRAHDRIAAAVSQHQVVLRYLRVKRIGWILREPVQRRGRIHVPEDRHRAAATQRAGISRSSNSSKTPTPLAFMTTSALRAISSACIPTAVPSAEYTWTRCPFGFFHVLVLLTFECVRLEERDSMS